MALMGYSQFLEKVNGVVTVTKYGPTIQRIFEHFSKQERQIDKWLVDTQLCVQKDVL